MQARERNAQIEVKIIMMPFRVIELKVQGGARTQALFWSKPGTCQQISVLTAWAAASSWQPALFRAACRVVTLVSLSSQELRSREEELSRAALQQKSQEELLKRREQQLAEREIDVLERELNILIFQMNQEKPNVKKRKGKFKRSRLKLKDGHRISLPSGTTLPPCLPRLLCVTLSPATLCGENWGEAGNGILKHRTSSVASLSSRPPRDELTGSHA